MCEKKVNMNLINFNDDVSRKFFGEELAGTRGFGCWQENVEDHRMNMEWKATDPICDNKGGDPISAYSTNPPIMPEQMYQQYYSVQPDVINQEQFSISDQKYADFEKVLDDEKHVNFENKQPMYIYYPVAINYPHSTPEVSRPFSLNEIVGLIEEFDGENSSVLFWIQTIEHWSKVYNWKDLEILKYASSRLVGAARFWYSGHTLYINSWRQLKEAIVREFPGRFTEADIHSRLRAMTKTEEETYAQFAYRVNQTAARGNVSEESAVVYIVSGLSYDPIYEDVRCGNYSTVKELVDHIKQICIHKSYDKRLHIPDNMSIEQEAEELERVTMSKSPEKSVMRKQCFRCDSEEHLIKDCPQMRKNSTAPENSICSTIVHGNNTSTIHAINGNSKSLTMNQDGITSCVISSAGYSEPRCCLIDTGSPYSLIRKSIVPSHSKVLLTDQKCTGLNGSAIEVIGETTVSLKCGNITEEVKLLVVNDDTMKVDVLLGRDYMLKNGVAYVKLNPEKNQSLDKHVSETYPVKTAFTNEAEDKCIEELMSISLEDNALHMVNDQQLRNDSGKENSTLVQCSKKKQKQMQSVVKNKDNQNIIKDRLCVAQNETENKCIKEFMSILLEDDALDLVNSKKVRHDNYEVNSTLKQSLENNKRVSQPVIKNQGNRNSLFEQGSAELNGVSCNGKKISRKPKCREKPMKLDIESHCNLKQNSSVSHIHTYEQELSSKNPCSENVQNANTMKTAVQNWMSNRRNRHKNLMNKMQAKCNEGDHALISTIASESNKKKVLDRDQYIRYDIGDNQSTWRKLTGKSATTLKKLYPSTTAPNKADSIEEDDVENL